MVRNIWAVGRNYADHAKELGNAVPAPAGEPMIFLKAGSCVVPAGEAIRLPSFSQEVHHEAEVALRFGPGLKFDAITIALDLTARDWQVKLKAAGHPWTLAKSFANSCPLGNFVKIPDGTDLQNLEFSLKVNGEVRQAGRTADMIHGIEKLRNYVIERFPVVEGDVLLTGTPAGVARMQSGDRMEASIKGLIEARWVVA